MNNGGPILSVLGSNLVGVLAGNAETQFDAASTGNLIGVDPVLLAYGDYGGPTDAYMISTCEPLEPRQRCGCVVGCRGRPARNHARRPSRHWRH